MVRENEMELDVIEYKVAQGEMTAAQVFTQMKQHIDRANKDGWNGAVDAAVELMSTGNGVDAGHLYDELHST